MKYFPGLTKLLLEMNLVFCASLWALLWVSVIPLESFTSQPMACPGSFQSSAFISCTNQSSPNLLQVSAAKGGSSEEQRHLAGLWGSVASPTGPSCASSWEMPPAQALDSAHPLCHSLPGKRARGDTQQEEQQYHRISGVLLSHPLALNADLSEIQSTNWWFCTRFPFFPQE